MDMTLWVELVVLVKNTSLLVARLETICWLWVVVGVDTSLLLVVLDSDLVPGEVGEVAVEVVVVEVEVEEGKVEEGKVEEGKVVV